MTDVDMPGCVPSSIGVRIGITKCVYYVLVNLHSLSLGGRWTDTWLRAWAGAGAVVRLPSF